MRSTFLARCAFLLIILQAVGPVSADPPVEVITRWFKPGTQHAERPVMEGETGVEQLARNIDWLEQQIDQWGTVVAKAPDVWGEARLTSHRQEIEELLRKELPNFDKGRLSGAQFVSDQAMLAAAFALKADTRPSDRRGANDGVQPPPISLTMQGMTAGEPGTNNVISSTTNLPTSQELFGFDVTTQQLFGGTESVLKLEQTEELDQLNRYLHHLASLRRINEGDDNSDMPGYSLNLVRIPISVLPGKYTKKGYGAEITATITPYLGPELLPMAYRDFVINDLVDQISVPLTRFLNGDRVQVEQLVMQLGQVRHAFAQINEQHSCLRIDPSVMQELDHLILADISDFIGPDGIPTGKRVTFDNVWDYKRKMECLHEMVAAATQQKSAKAINAFKSLKDAEKASFMDQLENIDPAINAFGNANLPEFFRNLQAEMQDQSNNNGEGATPNDPNGGASTNGGLNSPHIAPLRFVNANSPTDNSGQNVRQAVQGVTDALNASNAQRAITSVTDQFEAITGLLQSVTPLLAGLGQVQIPGNSARRSVLPFPVTELLDNYGLRELGLLGEAAFHHFKADVVNRNIVHLPDVQAFVREELSAAYDLLSTDEMRTWWETEASGQLVLYKIIRQRRLEELWTYRENFIDNVGGPNRNNITAAMAWCVFVESILLNERLIQDMRETAGNRPCPCDVPGWLPFFGPDPPMEARMAFNEYVKCRWPIRVFALDPVVSEQNIADISSVYRQMQMAVVLSFAGGDVGLSSALQAIRKLQRDRATIDLNRTAIAFGHGEDTFGWRFYPRFQTPPVQGNLTVFFRDLLIGGPTDRQIEHNEEIEPGMRECLAVVLMPSFVPYLEVDTRGNWFKLVNPGKTAVSITESVEFSRSIRAMQDLANYCVHEHSLYRNGEVSRLLRRVEQLERELPLQTLPCQVPIENTHGGFEIFSSGTRQLAPELLGWYGAPGYDPTRPTTLFLAGDSFSVSQSRLIVGNEDIPVRLLSRQIMEVTLPPGLPFLRDRNLYEKEMNEQYDGFLDAHLATPYGVSSHLLIPVIRQTNAGQLPQITVSSPTIHIRANYTGEGAARRIEAADMTQTSGGAPRVHVLPYVGINQPNVTLTMYPRLGNDRLTPASLAAVGPGPEPATYPMVLKDALAQPNGNLYKSLKHYADYLLAANPQREYHEQHLRIEVTVTLMADGTTTPRAVQGSFVIDLELRKKPAS